MLWLDNIDSWRKALEAVNKASELFYVFFYNALFVAEECFDYLMINFQLSQQANKENIWFWNSHPLV